MTCHRSTTGRSTLGTVLVDWDTIRFGAALRRPGSWTSGGRGGEPIARTEQLLQEILVVSPSYAQALLEKLRELPNDKLAELSPQSWKRAIRSAASPILYTEVIASFACKRSAPATKANRTAQHRRFLRRLQLMDKLSTRDRDTVLCAIDAFLAARRGS